MVYVTVYSTRAVYAPPGACIGCEGEANASVVRWRMPRVIDGVDMSACRMQVNYANAEGTGDVAEVASPAIGEKHIDLDWRVSALARAKAGIVSAGLELTGEDEDGAPIVFRSKPARFCVASPHPDEDPSGPSLIDADGVTVIAKEVG